MHFFNRFELSVLVVCTANVCRSPIAEGLLCQALEIRGLKKRVRVESAGSSAGQPGRAADPRAVNVCAAANIDISSIRARQVKTRDFERFDYILAVDGKSFQWLAEKAPAKGRARLLQMGEWQHGKYPVDVPDPYYGNVSSFEQVFGVLDTLMQDFARYVDCQLAHKTD